MSNYSQMLRDPRWQRKRLEVMKRAEFCCEACGDKSEELNVHHKYYDRGVAPWDYPVSAYQCLCCSCHKYVSTQQKQLEKLLADYPLEIYEIIQQELLSGHISMKAIKEQEDR
jgi:5-methylcytosine-specific restriction endonuclease McrA